MPDYQKQTASLPKVVNLIPLRTDYPVTSPDLTNIFPAGSPYKKFATAVAQSTERCQPHVLNILNCKQPGDSLQYHPTGGDHDAILQRHIVSYMLIDALVRIENPTKEQWDVTRHPLKERVEGANHGALHTNLKLGPTVILEKFETAVLEAQKPDHITEEQSLAGLCKRITACREQAKYDNIRSNVGEAALCIRYLLDSPEPPTVQGKRKTCATPGGVLPSKPEMEAWLKLQVSEAVEYKVSSHYDNTISFVLLVSPLLLLLRIPLASRAYRIPRKVLTRIMLQLGNCHPPGLQRLELKLLTLLVEVAKCNITIDEFIQLTLEHWKAVKGSLSPEDDSFYNTPNRVSCDPRAINEPSISDELVPQEKFSSSAVWRIPSPKFSDMHAFELFSDSLAPPETSNDLFSMYMTFAPTPTASHDVDIQSVSPSPTAGRLLMPPTIGTSPCTTVTLPAAIPSVLTPSNDTIPCSTKRGPQSIAEDADGSPPKKLRTTPPADDLPPSSYPPHVQSTSESLYTGVWSDQFPHSQEASTEGSQTDHTSGPTQLSGVATSLHGIDQDRFLSIVYHTLDQISSNNDNRSGPGILPGDVSAPDNSGGDGLNDRAMSSFTQLREPESDAVAGEPSNSDDHGPSSVADAINSAYRRTSRDPPSSPSPPSSTQLREPESDAVAGEPSNSDDHGPSSAADSINSAYNGEPSASDGLDEAGLNRRTSRDPPSSPSPPSSTQLREPESEAFAGEPSNSDDHGASSVADAINSAYRRTSRNPPSSPSPPSSTQLREPESDAVAGEPSNSDDHGPSSVANANNSESSSKVSSTPQPPFVPQPPKGPAPPPDLPSKKAKQPHGGITSGKSRDKRRNRDDLPLSSVTVSLRNPDPTIKKRAFGTAVRHITKFEANKVTPPPADRILSVHSPHKWYSDIAPGPHVVTIFGSDGLPNSVTIRLVTKTDHLMVSEMCQAAQSHHDLRTNAPDWISRPNNTTLHCTTATDWEALSPVEQSKRHNPSSAIVITGYEVSTKFDEEGLSSLGNYRALINIHDMSIPFRKDSPNDRILQGSLETLYTISRHDSRSSKPVAALNCPQPHRSDTPLSFALDAHAVSRTFSSDRCISSLPRDDTQFSLAATRGALTSWKVEPRGNATWFRVECGVQVFFLAFPKVDALCSDYTLWSRSTGALRALPYDDYHVVAVLLRPGSKIIIPPHTLYAFHTLEHSICSGGHFISTVTLTASVLGCFHTFFVGDIIANADQPTFSTRMNSIAAWYYESIINGPTTQHDLRHLGDYTTPQGLYRLVIFACYLELDAALCPTSYRPTSDKLVVSLIRNARLDPSTLLDKSNLTDSTYSRRQQAIYSKGCIALVLQHLFARLELTSEGKIQPGYDLLFKPMLTRMVASLIAYWNIIWISPHLDPSQAPASSPSERAREETQRRWTLFQQHTEALKDKFPWLKEALSQEDQSPLGNVSILAQCPDFTVREHAPAQDDMNIRDPAEEGFNPLDCQYFLFWQSSDQGEHHRF